MKKEDNSISKRFVKLEEACHKYPSLDLHVNSRATIHKECKGRAKDGFIEKFCK